MVSIRKRISKKRTRRQRRGKKQRGGQNTQQNMIERLAQNELQRKSQRKSQRGGGQMTDDDKIIRKAIPENVKEADVKVYKGAGVFFLTMGENEDKKISSSLHFGETYNGNDWTRNDVLDKFKALSETENHVDLQHWEELTDGGEDANGATTPGPPPIEVEGENGATTPDAEAKAKKDKVIKALTDKKKKMVESDRTDENIIEMIKEELIIDGMDQSDINTIKEEIEPSDLMESSD